MSESSGAEQPGARSKSAFPDLRIVPMDDLLLHEEVDYDRVSRLVDRLSADGLLKNPPIAASVVGSSKLMLLDGANRVAALRSLDVPHVLLQVEQYDDESLELGHWNHVVRDIEASSVIAKARELPGVTVEERAADQLDATGRDDHLCSFAFSADHALYLYGSHDLLERARAMCELARLYYRGGARLDRVSHTDFDLLSRHYQHVGALVVFPRFTKQDVWQVASAGELMPSGITRFLVPRRVLGFNLQVALLTSHLPLEEKKRWLEEAIATRIAERKVRYYSEPIFIFDE